MKLTCCRVFRSRPRHISLPRGWTHWRQPLRADRQRLPYKASLVQLRLQRPLQRGWARVRARSFTQLPECVPKRGRMRDAEQRPSLPVSRDDVTSKLGERPRLQPTDPLHRPHAERTRQLHRDAGLDSATEQVEPSRPRGQRLAGRGGCTHARRAPALCERAGAVLQQAGLPHGDPYEARRQLRRGRYEDLPASCPEPREAGQESVGRTGGVEWGPRVP